MLLDVTLRDGLYVASYLGDPEIAQAIIEGLIKASIPVIEVGYWRRAKVKEGPFSCNIEYLRSLPKTSETEYAIMVQADEWSSLDFEALSTTPIRILRFPCSASSVETLLPYIRKAKDVGFKVSFNLIRASEYSVFDIKRIGKLATDIEADWFYVADSNGALFPNQVKNIFNSLSNLNISLGFHAHDNQSLAFINTLTALENGATYIDSSLAGIGKGSNLCTELIASYLKVHKGKPFKMTEIFKLIHKVIYPHEGPYVLTKNENIATAMMHFNLDQITEFHKETCEIEVKDSCSEPFSVALAKKLDNINFLQNTTTTQQLRRM